MVPRRRRGTNTHLTEFSDIILPLDQREDADEPYDHDAEDIRDTWIQNMGDDG